MIDGIQRSGDVDHDFASDTPNQENLRVKDRVKIAIPHVGKRGGKAIWGRIIQRDAMPRVGVCRDVDGELSEIISNRRAYDKGEASRNN